MAKNDPAMGAPRKKIWRLNYSDGPMGFLADQICKRMHQVGYPARRYDLYRSAEEQKRKLAQGVSKAGAYSSAHQYYAAADIAHDRWAWGEDPDAPDLTQFWITLWDCVEVVEEQYNVAFAPRISWDPAHVELRDWRLFRSVVGLQEPSPVALQWYFERELPSVWKQHLRAVHQRAS